MADRAGPLVSVIVPSHNYGHFVGDAIQSVLDQTYRPTEVIVVDDGSTDDTPAVLGRFAGRIQALRLDGRGVSTARNVGLAHAEGEYVIFLDADDLLIQDGIAAQAARLLADPGLDGVIGAWYVSDTRLRTAALVRSPLGPGDVLPQILQGNLVTTPSALMLRRRAIVAAGGFDTGLSTAADWEMWIRLIRRGCRLDALRTPTAVYRIHGMSMSRDLDRAARDVLAVLDQTFGDPGLPAAARAVEAAAYSRMSQYLGQLYLEAGDEEGARVHWERALREDAACAGSIEFYYRMTRAIWKHHKIHGRPSAGVAASATRFAATLSGGRRASDQAVADLAVGLALRRAGATGVALRSLARAIGRDWRVLLSLPHLAAAARICAPPAATRILRAGCAAVRRADRLRTPALVDATLTSAGAPDTSAYSGPRA